MAEHPVVRPSRPSVRFAPLEVAVTMNITTKMKRIQPPVCAWSPIQAVRSA